MTYDFTPAAQRVLQFAAQLEGEGDIGRRLLLGLLAENESRAAGMLGRYGIDRAASEARWPEWSDFCETRKIADPAANRHVQVGPQLAQDLNRIESILAELPRPLAISTEHLLLAILDSSSEVGRWLNQQGVTSDELIAEIFRLHGVTPGPAEVDEHARQQQPIRQAAANTRVRILDASGNRASEALRVIEDYLRFGLGDAHLVALAKQLRHDLTSALAALPMPQRLAARDTSSDVGTSIATGDEYQRDTDESIVEANFSRLQQSLRSLEEFSKTNHANIAQQIEQLRYRAYTLHRAVGITCDSSRRLTDAKLYVLLDGGTDIIVLKQLATELVNSGVDVLQLRDKSLSDRELLQLAQTLREVTAATPALFIMNDRPDLAVLADADGVHVGQSELSVRDARKIIGPDKLVGVSTHNIDQARQAVLDGANYLGVGPMFQSRTKQFDTFAGLRFARQVAAEIELPAFAIGGIDAGNIRQIMETGMLRVAIGAAVTEAAHPAAAAETLSSIINRRADVDSDTIGERNSS